MTKDGWIQEIRLSEYGLTSFKAMDETLSPADQMTFHGPEAAGRPPDHTTFVPGRNTPPFSYVPARVGPPLPMSIGTAPQNLDLGYHDTTYYQPGSLSSTGQNSPIVPINHSFSSNQNNVATDQHQFRHQYNQPTETQTSFNEFIPPTSTIDLYAQPSFDPLSYTTWADPQSLENAGPNPNTTMSGLITSPVAEAPSRLGSSYGDNTTTTSYSSPGEMSPGGSELNFSGTTGLANHDSPASTPSSRHQDKKVKKSSDTNTTGPSPRKKQPAKRELRSASRTSKNAHKRPAETTEELKSRTSHNIVEKQYRNRLNAQFESLLHTLPEDVRRSRGDEERVSKAEVLDMARRHIEALEAGREALTSERDELREDLDRIKEAYAGHAGGGEFVGDGNG